MDDSFACGEKAGKGVGKLVGMLLAASDEDAKKDVKALTPYSYEYKDDAKSKPGTTEGRTAGFISSLAQGRRRSSIRGSSR